jgi:hypothetical protein
MLQPFSTRTGVLLCTVLLGVGVYAFTGLSNDLVVAVTAVPNGERMHIHGRVTDCRGKPEPNINLFFETSSGPHKVITDSEGLFRVRLGEPVVVRVSLFEPAVIFENLVSSGSLPTWRAGFRLDVRRQEWIHSIWVICLASSFFYLNVAFTLHLRRKGSRRSLLRLLEDQPHGKQRRGLHPP